MSLGTRTASYSRLVIVLGGSEIVTGSCSPGKEARALVKRTQEAQLRVGTHTPHAVHSVIIFQGTQETQTRADTLSGRLARSVWFTFF